MNQKHEQNIYDANLNVNLMTEKVIQIKSRLMTHVNVSAKIKKAFMQKRLYLESKYMYL